MNLENITRRHFFHRSSTGIGIAALASLLGRDARADRGLPGFPNFPPKAKRVIYLFQHGAPSQLDLFDYKPGLTAQRGQDLPESVRMGQRLTGMTAYQANSPPRRPSSNSPGTAKAARSSANSSPTPPKSRTSSASSNPSRPTPSITTRPSPSSRPASRSPDAPALALGSPTASAARTTTFPRS